MPNIASLIRIIPQRPYPDDSYFDTDRAALRRKILIFVCVFSLSCLLGLSYTFIRPAVYQSTATLLIIPPAAVAQTDNPAGGQHAAIQRHALTAHALLEKLHNHLVQGNPLPESFPDSVSDLRDRLQVIPVADTNLVELRAEGPQRDFLPLLVNSWVDLYLEAHAAAQRTSSDSASTDLGEQLQGLEQKVAEKRRELERFRRQYNIVSMEREENQVLSRLKGLSTSLNKAREEEAQAAARLNSIREALAKGKPVMRGQDQTGLANLERRATELREQLKAFERRFTPQYMALDPHTVELARRLEMVEEQIGRKRREGQQLALAEAEQALSSAQQNVAHLQQQLAEHQQTAMDFSERLAEHDSLQKELAQLETLYRQVRERLVQMEVNEREQFPQIQILEQAFLPDAPVRPHYLRDAGISLVGSLLLGLLAVWGYVFFTRVPRQSPMPELHPLLYPVTGLNTFPPTAANELPSEHAVPALEHQPTRELSEAEVSALLEAGDAGTRLLTGALLGGLDMEEAATLCWGHIDLEAGEIHVPGPSTRSLPLSNPLKASCAALLPDAPVSAETPLWRDAKGNPLNVTDLAALISCAAHDAGLAHPAEVTPEVLRHTYLVFLVRQGVRLTELKRVVGYLPPATLAAYSTFSPPGPGLSLERIERVYPALRHS